MSNKEKVLAYFEEWEGKGINPRNGCAIQKCPNHYLTGYFGIYIKGKRVASLSKKEQDEPFEAVARILQLDPPQAAPIKWTHVVDGGLEYWHSDCDKYFIGIYGNMSISAKYSIQDDRGIVAEWVLGDYVEIGEAFADCQTYKQQQFNQLGGYNEQ